MLSRINRTLSAAAALACVSALPAVAGAQECASLGLPNPIYGTGGSAVTPMLKAVARKILQADIPNDEKITILYADPSACSAYANYLAGSYKGTFKYWKAEDNTDYTCTAPAAGQEFDFAHMGNEADFCVGQTLPDDVGDFPAPIQTDNVIVHVNSSETSISAEALYLIYGFGQQGQVAPWTEGTGVIQRAATSFVHNFLARAIGVPDEGFRWKKKNEEDPTPNNEVTTNGDTVKRITDYVTGGGDPDQTLGYVSGSNADANRTKVRTLAYQHYDQTCAVYPDSTSSALDKINVRLGKYYLWAPAHFFARIDPDTKEILDPRVENMIGWFTDKTDAPGNVDVIRTVIESGDIPQCAMQAARDTSLGPIYSWAPPKPCGCFFEAAASGVVPTSCDPCETDEDCNDDAPSCNYGYCEAYRLDGEEEG